MESRQLVSIPKKIHYCWFGHAELPELAKRCLESWKEFFPDYEIQEWNEDNFDVNIIPYTQEAYEKKKYAFVSDYARFWILYHFGGIYFDTDVEVLRSFDSILQSGSYMGCERDAENNTIKGAKDCGIIVNPGLGMAAVPGLNLYKEILEHYESIHFLKDNGVIDTDTVVLKTTRILKAHGLQEIKGIQEVLGVRIYPSIYFCPDKETREAKSYDESTFSAHHYSASWKDESFKAKLAKPIWGRAIHFLGTSGIVARRLLGDQRWELFRDKYLRRLYNFVRGL